jgi:hypothetical protein
MLARDPCGRQTRPGNTGVIAECDFSEDETIVWAA